MRGSSTHPCRPPLFNNWENNRLNSLRLHFRLNCPKRCPRSVHCSFTEHLVSGCDKASISLQLRARPRCCWKLITPILKSALPPPCRLTCSSSTLLFSTSPRDTVSDGEPPLSCFPPCSHTCTFIPVITVSSLSRQLMTVSKVHCIHRINWTPQWHFPVRGRHVGGEWLCVRACVGVCAHLHALICPYLHGIEEIYLNPKSSWIKKKKKRIQHTQAGSARATDRQCVIAGSFFFSCFGNALFRAAVVHQPKAAEHIHGNSVKTFGSSKTCSLENI